MPTHAEKRVLPYSAQQMFDLVADVEKYPDFLPWVTQSIITGRQENCFIADLTVGYKFLTEKYSSKVCLEPYSRIDVIYLTGPFKYLNNHWVFEPLDDQRVCLDFYIDFEFRSSFFQGMMQTIFSEVVRRMIHSFEKRAEEIYHKIK
jgi:coenzyme Q-binding protein COQ10